MAMRFEFPESETTNYTRLRSPFVSQKNERGFSSGMVDKYVTFEKRRCNMYIGAQNLFG